MSGLSISKFYKSFSGTDTIAFLIFPGIHPIVIGSLSTISYSMYRNKVPVINIGRTNINGITRGSRIYAGTMVFTLINKHWLRELQDNADYLKDFPTLKVDELPLFDIMIISANEYGSACKMFIYGIDFTDESQTISVEDLFTENVFKFVARELSVFDERTVTSQETEKKYYTVKSNILRTYYTDEQQRQKNADETQTEYRYLTRSLYLITNGNPIMGNDVAAVQQLLNIALNKTNIPITYKFDRLTENAVKDFQTTAGLIVDGVVDNSVYTKLLQYTRDGSKGEFVQVINKSGAYVYIEPDNNSSVTKVLPYLSSVEVFNKVTDNEETYYRVQDGYVSLYDTYNYLDNKVDSYAFDQLKFSDTGSQVVSLQSSLEILYNNFKNFTHGTFDEITENYLKKFQRDNNLVETGVCDNYTWSVLMEQTEDAYIKYFMNHTEVNFTKEPGVYNIEKLSYLNEFSNTTINQYTNQVKYSAISIYKDNETKTDSKIFTFSGSQTHSISEFDNMFKDDPQHQTPTDVYYTIYPYGSSAYKWHFKVKE